jgi:putative phage-type endonuclease
MSEKIESDLCIILDTFIKSVKPIVQRSPEWHEARRNTIGGSEMSTILGINPFNKLKNFISEKIGMTRFNGSTPTRWGTIFESVTNLWMEKILKTSVKEMGGIHCAQITRLRYSPDGLAVITLGGKMYIILLEYKAPFSSFPNGKIPAHYMAQVQTGMLCIPIVHMTIFVNNVYRRCPLSDLNFHSVYDRCFHPSDFKKRKYGFTQYTPLAAGMIFFYQTAETYNELLIHTGHTDKLTETKSTFNDYTPVDFNLLTREEITDFGAVDANILERALYLYDSGKLRAEYYVAYNEEEIAKHLFVSKHHIDIHGDHITDESNFTQIEKFVERCTDKCIPVGYLPWKLFESDIIEIQRDPLWLKKIEEPVHTALKLLDQITSVQNPADEYYKTFSTGEIYDDGDFAIPDAQ